MLLLRAAGPERRRSGKEIGSESINFKWKHFDNLGEIHKRLY